jgi:hypothetical protein
MKLYFAFVFGSIIIVLFSCKTEEIVLHGEITGLVTDTLTRQPLQTVAVKLNPLNDTTSTGIDGKYLFKSLIPGFYGIEVTKPPFATATRNVTVTSARTKEVNFSLHSIQHPYFSSTHLDFGFDSTRNSFTITNIGTGKLQYSITTSQEWIDVNPDIGNITSEPHTINVTINRAGLSDKKYVESIEVDSHVGPNIARDTVYVLLNGIMDEDKNYYGTVTIGTQTWLSDNINIGKNIPVAEEQKDNGIIEKWCYDCKNLGGLYTFDEAVQYHAFDTLDAGLYVFGGPEMLDTIRGVCPDGWHVPNRHEWKILYDFLGYYKFFAELFDLGFNPLPSGQAFRTLDPNVIDPNPLDNHFAGQGEVAHALDCRWWAGGNYITSAYPGYFGICVLLNIEGNGHPTNYSDFEMVRSNMGLSVRCIKNPLKK